METHLYARMYAAETVFEAMGCYYYFYSCQEGCASLTDQDIERGNKKQR